MQRAASYLTPADLTPDETARANAILADARARGLSFAGAASYREGVRRRVKAEPHAGRNLIPTPPPNLNGKVGF